jgi:hypothetical protein
MAGWWFGTFLFFHSVGNISSSKLLLTPSFFRGSTTNQICSSQPQHRRERSHCTKDYSEAFRLHGGSAAGEGSVGKVQRKGAEAPWFPLKILPQEKAMEQHHGAHRNLVSHVLLGDVNCLSIDMGESTQSTPDHPFFVKMGVAPEQHSFFHPEAVMCGTEQQLFCPKGASFAAPFRVVGSVHLCRKIDLQN